jgi:Ca2+-binding RTX toxin-like protein
MIARKLCWLAACGGLAFILASIGSALATANTVAPSNAGAVVLPITANDLKPVECAGLNLTSMIVGSGTINGGSQAALILGSAGADTINGKGGNDCMLGGGGNDTFNGGNGGQDICIGGPDTDTFKNCETAIQ